MIVRLSLAALAAITVAFVAVRSDAVAGPPPSSTIDLGATAITGQSGTILLATIAPAGGGEILGRLCAPIEDAIATLPAAPFTDLPVGDDPCGDPTPDTLFDPGDYTVTAGIYQPGSQEPLRSVTLPVVAGSNATPLIDGARLSAYVIGDTDCDGDIDAVDALNVLKKIAALGPFAACVDQAGNARCDDGLASTDALFLLRFIAALGNNFPAGCDPLLGDTNITAPADGAVFTNFPREFDVEWDAVSGASSYIVQVDCLSCCIIGEFCADVGRGYRTFSGIEDTSFEANVGGDNDARVRVWAVGENGHPGFASEWRDFHFDTAPTALR